MVSVCSYHQKKEKGKGQGSNESIDETGIYPPFRFINYFVSIYKVFKFIKLFVNVYTSDAWHASPAQATAPS